MADIVQFYRVFHSMQYVPERLDVPTAFGADVQQLATMNREFADILTDGKFELHDPPPSEAADTSLASFTRLVLPVQPPQSWAAAKARGLDQRRSAVDGRSGLLTV